MDYLKYLTSSKDNRLDSSSKLLGVIIAVLTIYFLILAILSLKWSIVHDSPIMLYASFLMNTYDLVPYRDFFDMNMPGIHFFNSIFIRIFGLSDLGFRIGDMFYLSAILAATWFWMRKFGRTVAWYSAIVFGIVYLMRGPTMSMQREIILLLPIALALCFSSVSVKIKTIPRFVLVGLMFGLAAIIKPHAAIGLPPVLIYMLAENNEVESDKRKRILLYTKNILFMLIGFIIPLGACLIYLISTNALSSFIDIVRNYWPLYGNLTGNYQTNWGLEKYLYLMRGYLNFGGFSLWFIPAIIGLYISITGSALNKTEKRQALLLAGLTFMYGIYPIFAGKFWPYHWFIMLYFVILQGALCLINRASVKNRFERLFPIGIFLLLLVPGLRPTDNLLHNIIAYQVAGGNVRFMENRRATEIADFLEKNLEEGDLVQPLDWTGGAVHAMLISRARIATPFIYDFHFYHHISNRYIQNLRQKFMRDLSAVRPRFIIQILTNKPWPRGYDTSQEFIPLAQFIDNLYAPVHIGNGYNIYMLK